MLSDFILGCPVVDHLESTTLENCMDKDSLTCIIYKWHIACKIITNLKVERNIEIQTFITRGQHVIQHGVVSGGRSALPMRGFHVRKVYA